VADVKAALEKGDLKFTLNGTKLKGSWVLVRTRGFGGGGKRASWLLIKHRDRFASSKDITLEESRSALTRRLLAEIARDEGGNVEKAASGDPPDLGKAKDGTRQSGRARRSSQKRGRSK
jgi:bifunctional non-homologous end joining protein LigD